MLNKKMLFHVIYGVALVGAVMSFATNIGVVFVCRVIDAKVKKAENPSGQ